MNRNCAPTLTAVSGKPCPAHRQRAFTLLELMFAVATMAVLAAVAVPSYVRYVQRAQAGQAVRDIGTLQLRISKFSLANARLPLDLAELGAPQLVDPWNRPYVYLNFELNPPPGARRKDKNLVPLNTDYDLYSTGEDGRSNAPLTAAASRDDIIRANNGSYIGAAEDY
ncbi:MAG: prepilin-type N-terminal cleavage/methylation domain-containing protein [Steroidobacteraceae bacterium]